MPSASRFGGTLLLQSSGHYLQGGGRERHFALDVLDRETGRFLSTDARRELVFGLPGVPAPVLKRGVFARGQTIGAGLAPPLYRTPRWREALMEAAEESGSRPDMVRAQSDMSDLAEGLYVRIEAQDIVRERYKFVRGDVLQTIQGSDSHWHDRPILPNLRAGNRRPGRLRRPGRASGAARRPMIAIHEPAPNARGHSSRGAPMTDLRLSSVTLGAFFRDIGQPFLDAACTPLEAAGPGEIVGIELEIQYLRGGTLVVHAPERFLFQAENGRVRPTEWPLLGSAARSHVAVPALDLVHEVQRAARDLLPVIDHMSRQAEEDETFRLGLLHGGGYIAAMEIDPSVLGPDGPDAIDGRLAQALLDQGLQLVLPLHDSAHAAMAAIETMSRVHDIALDLHPVPIPGGEILEMVFHLPRRA